MLHCRNISKINRLKYIFKRPMFYGALFSVMFIFFSMTLTSQANAIEGYDPNSGGTLPGGTNAPTLPPVTKRIYVNTSIKITVPKDSTNTYGPADLYQYSKDDKTNNTANATKLVTDSRTKTTAGSTSIDLVNQQIDSLTNPSAYKICIKDGTNCSDITKQSEDTSGVTYTATINISEKDSVNYIAKTLTPPSSSCGDSVPGLGWIICPIINGLTSLNDAIWDLASLLLKVNPITQSDSIYSAWGTIRNIANVAFVIVFLMIIFSQLISFGFSNYNIKKLLPRLLISAILVNISFILVQLAVDIANILGSGLFDLLAGMAQKPTPTWSDLISALLTGGVGAAVGGVAIFAVGGIAAAFWLILPMALMGALGLLAAIVTLIFRQAIIPILAILAPLAFVAYLLPNTEAWFKKWRELLVSMLMLYPLAGIIFGGARFAASVIAENGGWFNKLIGLIMLTLPLFSLPYLASKSGALVNKVGGVLNGLANRAGKPIGDWANKNAGYAKNQANNRAMNSTSTFGVNAYRRSRLQKSARNEAIDQSQQREFTRAKTGYIANETSKESSTLRRQMVVGAAAGAADRALANADYTNSKLQGEEISAASSIQQGIINRIKGEPISTIKGAPSASDKINEYLTGQAISGSSAHKSAALDLLAKNGQDGILREMVNNPTKYNTIDQADLQSTILSNVSSLVNSAPDLVKGPNGAFNNMTGDALSKMSPTSTVAYMEYMDKLRVSDPGKFAGVAESFNSAVNDIALNPSLQSVFRGNIGKTLLNPTKKMPSPENAEIEIEVSAVSPDLLSQLQKGLNFIDADSGKIRSTYNTQPNSQRTQTPNEQPRQTPPGATGQNPDGSYHDKDGKKMSDSGIYF